MVYNNILTLDSRLDVLSMYPEELEELMRDMSYPPYRAGQIFAWLTKGASDFSEMSNLSGILRDELEKRCVIASPVLHKRLVSKLAGTEKYLFKLWDGQIIETALLRYEHGNTLCVSTQVGCRMGCTFCASTIAGLTRNLTAGEILGQVIQAGRITGERVSNVVLMGIGEPLDNYDNVLRFLKLVNHEKGLNIGYRHISLSTCGLYDGIIRLAGENLPITLSVSLHAADDETRKSIMPVARKYSLSQLMEACRIWGVNGRRISFEYALIEEVNDTPEQAKALLSLLKGLSCHVNLIPVNPVKGREHRQSGRQRVERFRSILTAGGLIATVRRKLGGDIEASCGQLRRSEALKQAEEILNK